MCQNSDINKAEFNEIQFDKVQYFDETQFLTTCKWNVIFNKMLLSMKWSM